MPPTISISTPHFTALLYLDSGRVISSSPDVNYMIGWRRQAVISHITNNRNWTYVEHSSAPLSEPDHLPSNLTFGDILEEDAS